jgi:hypothetical protein
LEIAGRNLITRKQFLHYLVQVDSFYFIILKEIFWILIAEARQMIIRSKL